MGAEIERKFLVAASWQPTDAGTHFQQGYLNSDRERVVRVRLQGDSAKLTIKGVTTGVTRAEYEYDIPVDDAPALLALCEQPLIEKRRHLEQHGGKTWEIDVFLGANAGLVIAELELGSEDEAFERPPWLGDEVSGDPRYYNNNLIAHPMGTST
ncbi:MAG: CYTH domain-containing protein [Kofleriaceae bacterium]